MALIPQAFIDDLIARTDIVPLIDARVPLKRQGSEYAACCPFHDEKSPSFTVSPAKQFYHCFGCGAHGTALGFMMEYDRLEFRDAVEELARLNGMEVPKDAQDSGPRIDPTLYDATATAQRLFTDALRRTPAAVDYLKQRGLDGETAKAFGVGFAPDAWQTVTDAVRNQKLAVEAGLAIRNDSGRVYDRFRNRITFPIRDTRGRVISFGGRKFADGDDGPKYLNGPESPIFHKGRQLYGLYEARQANAKPTRLLIVEGYMDVVSLAQFGVTEAVATLGTATTAEHLELLFRTAPQAVFCFDGDRAGRDAAWKAVERALPALRDGREVRLLFLPDGEDPDSMVRRVGAEAFRALLDAATPLSEFLLDQLGQQADLSSVDGRARFVDLARPHLAALRPGAFRSGLLGAVADRAGLERAEIEQIVAQGGSAKPRPRRSEPATPKSARHAAPAFGNEPMGFSAEDDDMPAWLGDTDAGGSSPQTATADVLDLSGPAARAARLILAQPSLAEQVSDSADFGSAPAAQALALLVGLCQDAPGLTTAQLEERLRGTLLGPAVSAMNQHQLPEDLDLSAEFDAVLQTLDAQAAKARRDALLAAARTRELTAGEAAELKRLFARSG